LDTESGSGPSAASAPASRPRPLRSVDLPWAEALLERELGGRRQARLGVVVDVLAGPGLVAVDAVGRPLGLVTWEVGGADSESDEAEIRALVVADGRRGQGVGAGLLGAAEAALARAGVHRAWLLTTNDNVEALTLYQRHGWRLLALHPGAVDDARARLKPTIGRLGAHGIPIRDELVLRKDL
jgi:ribosomal protein S18 acetylase RimI-like enzyme